MENEVGKKENVKDFLPQDLFAEFMSYTPKQQLYCKYRGVGFNQEKGWLAAGFAKTNARQNASSFEKNHPLALEIIKAMQVKAKLGGLGKENSVITKEIENNVAKGRTALDIIATKKGEEANQLKFYVDVISGNIKQTKKTTTTDSEGKQVVKVEEIEPSISERLKAREKMDSLLGIDDIKNVMGEVQVNKDITIKIVDTSAPKDLAEEKPVIDMEENDDGTFVEGDSDE